jgi:hypothetical protein
VTPEPVAGALTKRGGSPAIVAAARAALIVAMLDFATPAGAESFVARGGCRDGAPHGAYELRSTGGALRAIGAFNRGKRTGSFIFWNDAGVRIAHVPYEDDVVNGTVAFWYAAPARGGASQQKREVAYAAGRRNGTARSWQPDGRRRVEAEYREGELAAVDAWDVRDRPLPQTDARALERRDAASDESEFRALEGLVRRHPPEGCGAPGVQTPG